jgi:hypothetical protein
MAAASHAAGFNAIVVKRQTRQVENLRRASALRVRLPPIALLGTW